MFADICTGLISILTPETIGAVALGIFTGLMFGAIPGISGIMAISILLPLTFYVSPLVGIPMLLGIYKASMFGGSITAVLLNTPRRAARPSAPLWTATPSPSRAKRARASTRRWSARCSGTRSATSCSSAWPPPCPISPSKSAPSSSAASSCWP